MNREELKRKFRAYIAYNYGNQTEAAKHYKVSPAYISEIWRGNKLPSPDMLSDMGLEKEVVFVKKKSKN